MGYKYGIWLVYDNDQLITEHMGHITIACFMEQSEAKELYDDILNNVGETAKVELRGKPEYFYSSFYKHDNNKLCAWGYNGTCDNWSLYEELCNKYTCDFSPIPHISKDYNIYPNLLTPHEITDITLSCKVYCADIRSDFPVDWKIINYPS